MENNKLLPFEDYITQIKQKYRIDREDYEKSLSEFLISNDWLDKDIKMIDGKLYATEEFMERNGKRIERHARCYHLSFEEKNQILMQELRAIAPNTADLLEKYSKEYMLEDETIYILLDFLCYYQTDELPKLTDREVETLVEDAIQSIPKTYGDILCEFVNWVKTVTKTAYSNSYKMPNYSSREDESSAYSQDMFLRLIYYLFNEVYNQENMMYFNAAQSRKYVDTWLFLAIHCICALRKTDLARIPHPRLPCSPEEVLEQVAHDTFSDEDAKACLYSILYTLSVLDYRPNKTKNVSGVSNIKFTVPQSVETHIGKLFAVAEAHFQLQECDPSKPLIRAISDYKSIRRHMGEDIGDLFIEADFRSRSANKSFLQMIYLMADKVSEQGNDEFRVKGYILAALARSHKGGYGEFAKTTSIYLKDAKMSGFTPEFVAREMMERGVLSCIADMLLKMVCGEQYTALSVENQTKAIQALNLSPLDIEETVAIMQQAEKQAMGIAKNIYENNSRETVINILHRLGNGEAASKQSGCLCLMTAMQRPCAHDDRYHTCIGCEYEISTKATVFFLMSEYKRLLKEYDESGNPAVKEKCKALAGRVIVPAVKEILKVMKDSYGKESVAELMNIVRKVSGNEDQQ